jgi:hypothetical protein
MTTRPDTDGWPSVSPIQFAIARVPEWMCVRVRDGYDRRAGQDGAS